MRSNNEATNFIVESGMRSHASNNATKYLERRNQNRIQSSDLAVTAAAADRQWWPAVTRLSIRLAFVQRCYALQCNPSSCNSETHANNITARLRPVEERWSTLRSRRTRKPPGSRGRRCPPSGRAAPCQSPPRCGPRSSTGSRKQLCYRVMSAIKICDQQP